MKPRFTALTIALLACAISSAGQDQDKALDKLIRAFEVQRDVKATLIQERRSLTHKITVKIQIVPGRGIRTSVLEPALKSGIVSFDDGVSYRVYDPREKLVTVEQSPMAYKFDLNERRALIKKNYEVKLGDTAQLAGRDVQVVNLKALKSGVFDRSVYIDQESDLILKYVVERRGQEKTSLIETIVVKMTASADSQFSTVGPPGTKVVKSTAPIEVEKIQDTFKYLSFRPAVPDSLPSGFELQAKHIVRFKDTNFLALRLTDGMSFVTVYLYPSTKKGERGERVPLKESEIPLKGQMLTEARDGVRCWVVGDVDDVLKERLAKVFIGAYSRTIE